MSILEKHEVSQVQGPKNTYRKKAEPQFLKRYSSLIIYTLALLPILFQSLTAKYTLLTVNGGGYEAIALQKGYSRVEQLSLWDIYIPFISDLVIFSIFLAAALLLILFVANPVFRAGIAAFLALIPTLILFIQIKGFWEVGTFLPISVLIAGITDTGNIFITDYVKIPSLLKLLILMLFSLIMILLAQRLEKKREAQKIKYNFSLKKFFLLVAIMSIFTSTWAKVSIHNEYSNSVLISTFKSFIDYTDVTPSDFENLKPVELLKKYKEFTNSNSNNIKSKYWGKAKDYDVMFFILESVPAQCASPINELPNINSLRSQAFISSNHYSTYPYTVRALFSIYSSWYPSNKSKDFIKTFDSRGEKLNAPGVVRSLKKIGYKTAVFVPDYTDNWEHDKQRYEALGFDEQIFPAVDFLKNIKRGNTGWRDNTKLRDEATLSLLKENLITTIKNNERYLYAFQPQYTHGPWPNIKPNFSVEDTMKECTKLLKTVDGWIGEIVQLLRARNRLEKTLIVITGDHGIRTNKEHPGFNGGIIDGITFNVPLLIYSPNVINKAKYINSVSSHIDITPTLLSLLGVENGRKYEQGTPIWSNSLKDRYTFFFAKNYLGADAFYYKNNIYMIRHLFKSTKHATWNNRLNFQGASNTNKDLSEAITTKIHNMNDLQNNWAHMLLPSIMKTPSD